MRSDYDIHEVRPYINWTYFYHAWGVAADRLEDERIRLRADADQVLDDMDGRFQTHSLFLLMPAASDGDDIVLPGARLPMLRQQGGEGTSLCMADFIKPIGATGKVVWDAEDESSTPDSTSQVPDISTHIGLFAASVDAHFTDGDAPSDDYRQLLLQTLADRLAEATAERLHQRVRREFWGYAPDEQLTMDELHQERFQGIRPAVGYPSLPDMSMNFVLDTLLDMQQIGIQLTESGMMRPHASVSGLMLAHPEARYFDVGRIGPDQLFDYARRRHIPAERLRAFLRVG